MTQEEREKKEKDEKAERVKQKAEQEKWRKEAEAYQERYLDTKKLLLDAQDVLLKDSPYYGLFMESLYWEYHDRFETMGVSVRGKGKNTLVYGSNIGKWPKTMLPPVLQHEVLHIMCEHHYRRGQKDPFMWNLACDVSINQLIDWPTEVTESKFCPLFPKPNWPKLQTADVYYRLLEDECKKNGKENVIIMSGSGGGQGQSGQGGGNVMVDDGEDAKDGDGKSQEQDDEEGSDGNGAVGIKGAKGKRFDSHESWVDTPKSLDEAKQKLREAVKKAMDKMKEAGTSSGGFGQRGGRSCGHGSGNLVEQVATRILKQEPKWQDLVESGLGASLSTERFQTWKKVNRRCDFGIKGFKHSRKASLVFAIDTSGSMNIELLKQIYSEIQHFLVKNPSMQITMIECDDEVKRSYPMLAGQPCDVHGGGGTAFTPVYKAVKTMPNKPQQVMYFTDGGNDGGDTANLNSLGAIPAVDWVWVLYGNSRKPSNWGRCIEARMDDWGEGD